MPSSAFELEPLPSSPTLAVAGSVTMTTSSSSHHPLKEQGRSQDEQPQASETATPYWNVNVPPSLQTTSCPPYLLNLSSKDHDHLLIPDSLYTRLVWPAVQHLVQSGRLQDFARLPSDLHRYRKFVWDVAREYGSVERFMLEERLGWGETELKQGRARRPFEKKEDVKILRNDWPYGVEEGIEHLVVWTKFSLGGEEQGEDAGTAAIEEFMKDTFYSHVPRSKVVWFRNWAALKSVHAVEHFHVMLLNPDRCFLDSVVEQPASLR